jgi:hypothetical protein
MKKITVTMADKNPRKISERKNLAINAFHLLGQSGTIDHSFM